MVLEDYSTCALLDNATVKCWAEKQVGWARPRGRHDPGRPIGRDGRQPPDPSAAL